MFIIIGLGNPGKEHQSTPHNAGFMALDEFASKNGFPEFALNKKSNSLVSEGAFNGQKTVLAKPQTFMNNSGSAVRSLYTKHIVVVHDDIDLPLGTIKVSTNRGSAGHKGVESIIQALGTKNFTRIRIGVQPSTGKPEKTEAFVIKKLPKDKQEILALGIQNALTALDSILYKHK